ncbi:MAG: hypothetical protein COV74_00515 [Candidatus Omnitrophica bacterium CG11_big_fil_rev_8_21_14_0_20_45_26]|uniref:Lipoprotein n=1 Tax=Candidatus Abzuiibacterium crystallinum TaxID=1974748 RepID=A0A2H0LSZ6_9BACT|nr:MAG: hypothetical protein COV74_00515 [Candidatus Omnitrophica bacterium CG11_big_fil_rev_8_21_14_0_20_45_26]PIW63371.1 MAG: hypothetical protein COW12_10595 [Candidatus Omnitrophica bacterium CG12_big_fil_rev_8_21_14_0_65_45_16]
MKKNAIVLSILFLMAVTGCVHSDILEPVQYPTYVYKQPLDLVYLKTLETVDSYEGWILNPTHKAEGYIEARNVVYGNLFDRDTQYVRFVVKPVDRDRTSLEIDLDKSRCKETVCLDMLEKIHSVIDALPKRELTEEASQEPAPEEEPMNMPPDTASAEY